MVRYPECVEVVLVEQKADAMARYEKEATLPSIDTDGNSAS